MHFGPLRTLHPSQLTYGTPKDRTNRPPPAQALFFPPPGSPGEKWPLVKPKKLPYKTVALGGTFDNFHRGHERLFSAAFENGQRVFIGVTTDRFVRTLRKHHPVQPYASRVKTITRFLRTKRWLSRAVIAPLNDPYGPAATRPEIEALVITPDTLASARRLNRLRKNATLSTLEIQKVPLSKAEDGGPISSTRIRRREIDRDGRVILR